jgi:hypothetical protein
MSAAACAVAEIGQGAAVDVQSVAKRLKIDHGTAKARLWRALSAGYVEKIGRKFKATIAEPNQRVLARMGGGDWRPLVSR